MWNAMNIHFLSEIFVTLYIFCWYNAFILRIINRN